MTYADIVAIAKATNESGERLFSDVAYDHFAEGTNPKPPFLLFHILRSNNFGADNVVYKKIVELNFEIYTEIKNPEIEKEFEDVLDNAELFYNKNEEWLSEEKLFVTTYSMEVPYDG